MLTKEELEVAAVAAANYPANNGDVWAYRSTCKYRPIHGTELIEQLERGEVSFDDC